MTRLRNATIGALLVLVATAGLALSASGDITTVAGSGIKGFFGDGGSALDAQFFSPYAVAVDGDGNLFIADKYNHRIRRVDAIFGIITTVAGTGVAGFSGDGAAATSAEIDGPTGIAVDSSGNLFIADFHNNRVRRVADGVITTLAGTGAYGYSGDGVAAPDAELSGPVGVAVDGDGNVFFTDSDNHAVRRVDAISGIISTVAGIGTAGFSGDGNVATAAQLDSPYAVAVDADGNVYIADRSNHAVRRVDGSTGIITSVAGTGTAGFSGDGGPASGAVLASPFGIATDSAGNLYIADVDNQRIRWVGAGSGVIVTVAGTGTKGFSGDGGTAIEARLRNPLGVAVAVDGTLFVADTGNHRIRRIAALSCRGVLATIVGGSAPDVLDGTVGDDVILGLGGADTIDGGDGADLICAGTGADTVDGGDGKDRIYGEDGADTLSGNEMSDRIYGGDGADVLRGNRGTRDRLFGGDGIDDLGGGPGTDDRCIAGETTAECEVVA